MARTYTTVGWEDGTVLQPAKVTVQGTEYNVENEVVTGRTPINAQNLRKMDNEIKRIVEEDIPSVYDEKLLTISDTAPSECIEGDKYYNTTDNKIYTAVATDTWSQDGDTPIEGKLYIVFNEQSTYAYNGTTLVSVGGGSGSSDIVVVPTEIPTEETKLEIEDEDFDFNGSEITDEYSESTEVGYSANYSNGHFQTKGQVLWTNPSPTASYSSGEIPLNLSKYKFVDIIYRRYPSIDLRTFVDRIFVGDMSELKYHDYEQGSIRTWGRFINVESDKVTFADCYINSTLTNNGLVPYKIIGYKEV